MSRFYQIAITPKPPPDKQVVSGLGVTVTATPGKVWVSPSLAGLGVTDFSYSSIIDGDSNPSALDIEVDIPTFTMDAPRGAARVRIYGVSLGEITYLPRLMGGEFKISAGMRQPGLPLAKSRTENQLLHGTLWQAGGVWEGTSMYADFVIVPLFTPGSGVSPYEDAPKALSWTWSPGQNIKDSIQQTVEAAYGGQYKVVGSVSPDLKATQTWPGTFDKLSALGEEIQRITDGRRAGSLYKGIKTVNGGRYSGVHFIVKGKEIQVYDNTDPQSPSGNTSYSNPRKIEFTDMIGQPSWKDAFTINVKVAMRGDIWPLDWMTFSQTLQVPYVQRPASASGVPGIILPSRDESAMRGVFLVNDVRHTGKFRGADGNSWVTSIDAISQASVASGGGSASP